MTILFSFYLIFLIKFCKIVILISNIIFIKFCEKIQTFKSPTTSSWTNLNRRDNGGDPSPCIRGYIELKN